MLMPSPLCLDSDNPYPHFHAYECYAALNNKEDAEKALNLASKLTIGVDTYRDLQEEIDLAQKV